MYSNFVHSNLYLVLIFKVFGVKKNLKTVKTKKNKWAKLFNLELNKNK